MKNRNYPNLITCTFISDCSFTIDLLKPYMYSNKGILSYFRDFSSEIPNTDIYVLLSDNIEKIKKYLKLTTNLKKPKIVVTSKINSPILANSLKYGAFGIYERNSFLDIINLNLVHLLLYREAMSLCLRNEIMALSGLDKFKE